MSVRYNHYEYLASFLEKDRRKEAMRKALKILEKHKFDAIAFSGNSGAMIGGALAVALDKHPILVRKSTKDCHSAMMVEGFYPIKKTRYIIVDDFFDSGKTAKHILTKVAEFNPKLTCVGAYAFDVNDGDREVRLCRDEDCEGCECNLTILK